MIKIYHAAILLFMSCGYAFAQSKSTEIINMAPTTENVAPTTNAVEPTNALRSPSDGTVVLEKIALPANQKVTPAVFYVHNDQPVDLQTYQRHIKPATSKN